MSTRAEQRRRLLENHVARYIEAEELLPAGSLVIVGVSGGPDSTALLLILGRLAARRQVEVKAAYFDHKLRGEEAAECERRAVSRLADVAGVELVCGAGDVRGFAADEGLSLEDAARRARYGFLGRTAAEARSGLVAVGHTFDDQAETVLMHILRGAGLAGIAGMARRSPLPAAGVPGIALIRPLLGVRRAETITYCNDTGVVPVDDDSNRSRVYLRNRLRLDVMPALSEFNRDVAGALVRLAGAARADQTLIEAAAERLLAAAAGEEGLDRGLLRSSPKPIRRQALQAAIVQLAGDAQGFGERHWAALDRAIEAPAGTHLDLPRSVVADVFPGTLQLRRRKDVGPAATIPGCVEFSLPGQASLGAWRLAASNAVLPGAAAAAEVDAAAAGTVLTVRSRQPGDRFQPLGLAGTKKLQDYFTDARVPRSERDGVPIFAAARGIIWVAGHRIAEWARPRPGRPSLILSYRRDVTAAEEA